MHFRLADGLRADARYPLAVGHAPPRLTLTCRLCCASALVTFGTYDRKDAAGFFEADTYGEVERHSGGASRQSRRYTHFSGCHFSDSYRPHFFRRGTAPVPEPCRLRDRHVFGDGGRVPVDPHPRAWPRAYRAAVSGSMPTRSASAGFTASRSWRARRCAASTAFSSCWRGRSPTPSTPFCCSL